MDLIFKSINKDRLYVKYTGKIFIENSNEIKDEIKANLDNVKELVFDFEEVPYISSAGLRMLVEINKVLYAQGGSLYIKNANEEVKNVFAISGFNSDFKII